MMHAFIVKVGALLAGLLWAVPVCAQADAAPEQCELHVWPAGGLGQVRQRGSESLSGKGVIPALLKSLQESAAERADSRTTAAIAALNAPEPLSTREQIRTLEGLPLPAMLGLPGYRLVVHDSALDSRTVRTVKSRYAQSDAACYADLVVDDVVYSREYTRGQNLKAFFRFRDFTTQAAPVRTFATWVQTKLRIFSLDPPNLSVEALDEIASALRSNTMAFANLLLKRPSVSAIVPSHGGNR